MRKESDRCKIRKRTNLRSTNEGNGEKQVIKEYNWARTTRGREASGPSSVFDHDLEVATPAELPCGEYGRRLPRKQKIPVYCLQVQVAEDKAMAIFLGRWRQRGASRVEEYLKGVLGGSWKSMRVGKRAEMWLKSLRLYWVAFFFFRLFSAWLLPAGLLT